MLKKWILQTIAIMLLAYLLPGVTVKNWIYAAIAAVGLGLLNALVRPILIILTFPINVLTLGLFTLVINTIIIMIASYFLPGFEVAGALWAFLFSVGLSIWNGILD